MLWCFSWHPRSQCWLQLYFRAKMTCRTQQCISALLWWRTSSKFLCFSRDSSDLWWRRGCRCWSASVQRCSGASVQFLSESAGHQAFWGRFIPGQSAGMASPVPTTLRQRACLTNQTKTGMLGWGRPVRIKRWRQKKRKDRVKRTLLFSSTVLYSRASLLAVSSAFDAGPTIISNLLLIWCWRPKSLRIKKQNKNTTLPQILLRQQQQINVTQRFAKVENVHVFTFRVSARSHLRHQISIQKHNRNSINPLFPAF